MLHELNTQQREAAEHTTGPLMILAGAGAGKTKTITYRIAHLIRSGVAAQSILAVTFTNKAAGEMRERVEQLLGAHPQPDGPLSGNNDTKGGGARLPLTATFHALGVRVLREHAPLLDLPRSFSIWDRTDSVRACKAALADLGLDKQYEAKHILGRISREKGDAHSCTQFSERAHTPWEQVVADVWQRYEAALAREGALDFDDLLVRTLRLLQEHRDVLEKLRARWTHIHVDEYQDTNQVQFEIAHLLAGERANICVVGDIDQNIYSWRGADIRHLLTFEKLFPNTTTVFLEQNYRSTKTIVGAAHAVISKNTNRHEKHLFTENPDGDPIRIYAARDERDEASHITAQIGDLLQNGADAGSIAVLYRTNAQSRTIEEALVYAGIPYRVLGTKFFDRKEVKDVLAYLRAALNERAWGDFVRAAQTPARGIGKVTLATLARDEHALAPVARHKIETFRALLTRIREAAETLPVADVIRRIVQESGLDAHLSKQGDEGAERIENVRELVALAEQYRDLAPLEGAQRLLEDAALLGDQDELDERVSAVSLMTVHAAKGLEFDTVFVTGLEDGRFPHIRGDDEAVDAEEERRLFYVALTRAQKQVYLTHAASRQVYGTRELCTPSIFLEDLEERYCEHVAPPNAGPAFRRTGPASRGGGLLDEYPVIL